MGSGKSTVGKALSEKTGFTFIDMDDEIVKREGRSINDIFKDDGEEYFRNLETSLLKEYAASDEKIILSTGGGVILREENVMLLKKIGKIFFLQADTDELIRRLSGDTTRPLLKSSSKEELQARIEKMIAERMPKYEKAYDVIVDTTGRTAEEISDNILENT